MFFFGVLVMLSQWRVKCKMKLVADENDCCCGGPSALIKKVKKAPMFTEKQLRLMKQAELSQGEV